MNPTHQLRSLWDVIKIEAENVAVLTHMLGTLSAQLTSTSLIPTARELPFLPAMKEGTLSMLQSAVAVIDNSGLSYSKGFLELVLNRIKSDQPANRVGEALNMLQKAIQIELSNTHVFSLLPREAEFFAPPTPLFGPDVAKQFISLRYDVEEAGKCYALGRSTASVYHTIRCLEAAILAMARCLGIPDPIKGSQRNWGVVLKTISEEIDRRWPKSSRLSGDGVFFGISHAILVAMQDPYRNPTMHLGKKYTEEEALHTFELVKGFMQKIASRMDENGQPLA